MCLWFKLSPQTTRYCFSLFFFVFFLVLVCILLFAHTVAATLASHLIRTSCTRGSLTHALLVMAALPLLLSLLRQRCMCSSYLLIPPRQTSRSLAPRGSCCIFFFFFLDLSHIIIHSIASTNSSLIAMLFWWCGSYDCFQTFFSNANATTQALFFGGSLCFFIIIFSNLFIYI